MTGIGPGEPDVPGNANSPIIPVVAAADRDPDLVLAGLHLRLGALGLARAELEGFAGAGRLDTLGLADLAEVRWRTGDLVGAGEAAAVALDGGDAGLVATVVAAEAMADLGRPGEARRLAGRALEASGGTLDRIFAGMPRSSVWPTDSAPSDGDAGTGVGSLEGTGQAGMADGRAGLPDPVLMLEAGRRALDAGDVERATVHQAIALRIAPALAPAVLEVLEGVEGAAAAIVRGDAYRLVGHERDARVEFAAAATAIEPADERATDGGTASSDQST